MFNLIANSLDPISQELKDRTISFNGAKLKKKKKKKVQWGGEVRTLMIDSLRRNGTCSLVSY